MLEITEEGRRAAKAQQGGDRPLSDADRQRIRDRGWYVADDGGVYDQGSRRMISPAAVAGVLNAEAVKGLVPPLRPVPAGAAALAAMCPDPLTVPAPGVTLPVDTSGAPLCSSYAEHGGSVTVQFIDAAGSASPALAAQLGASAPSGMPGQPPEGMAPSAYGPVPRVSPPQGSVPLARMPGGTA
jgi:hypothetical protein